MIDVAAEHADTSIVRTVAATDLWKHTVVVGVAIASWEMATAIGLVDPFWVSSPSRVVSVLVDDIAGLLGHLFATAVAAFIGLTIALILAIPIVALITVSRFAEEVLEPLIDFVYAIPKVALIPVLVLTIGIGDAPKIALVAMLVVFIFIYTLRAGTREVDESLVKVMEILGARRREVLMHVVIPTVASYLIAALRVAGPLALNAAIFAEYFAGQRGIGKVVYEAGLFFQSDRLFAAIVLIVPVAFLLDLALQRLDDKANRWRRL